MSALPWQDPYWVRDRPKHWPPPNSIWDRVIEQTGEKKQPARYSPSLSIGEIEQLELECVQGAGVEFESPEPHVRYFYQEFGIDVGASKGKLVKFIYVEYHQSGAVHGRPITREELRRKGAEL